MPYNDNDLNSLLTDSKSRVNTLQSIGSKAGLEIGRNAGSFSSLNSPSHWDSKNNFLIITIFIFASVIMGCMLYYLLKSKNNEKKSNVITQDHQTDLPKKISTDDPLKLGYPETPAAFSPLQIPSPTTFGIASALPSKIRQSVSLPNSLGARTPISKVDKPWHSSTLGTITPYVGTPLKGANRHKEKELRIRPGGVPGPNLNMTPKYLDFNSPEPNNSHIEPANIEYIKEMSKKLADSAEKHFRKRNIEAKVNSSVAVSK